ncbi:MAG: endonuclease III [Parachlamydiaceae bacterium]
MNKKERVAYIQEKLQELFPNPEIPLNHSSPFTLLIAVLLSAQCTDARVNAVTPQLFALGNTAQKLAKVPVHKIEETIRSLGLSKRKAEAVHALSNKLVMEFHGEVPKDWDALESLPGVGHKTASVVMSQAFHEPAFPVDTHIHRLAHRWGLSNGKNVEQTEADLKKLFPKKLWNHLHLQIIYYARIYCPARSHDITRCPICNKFAE